MKKKDKEHLSSPEGWDCYICGQYYKIGRFNRPYVYRVNEWVITKNMPLATIYKAIEALKAGMAAPKIKRHYVTHGNEGVKKKPKAPDTLKWMILDVKPILTQDSALAARNAMIERMRVKRHD